MKINNKIKIIKRKKFEKRKWFFQKLIVNGMIKMISSSRVKNIIIKLKKEYEKAERFFKKILNPHSNGELLKILCKNFLLVVRLERRKINKMNRNNSGK